MATSEETEKLRSIFYEQTPANLTEFYRLIKGTKITQQKAKSFYYDQDVNQILKKTNQKKKFTRIHCPFRQPGCLQMDLMSMQKSSKKNSGNTFILVIIDIFSRYLWAYKLQSKSIDDVYPEFIKAMKNFRKHYPRNQISMTLDNGTEFQGKILKYMRDKNFTLFYANPDKGTKSRTQVVERSIRTLRERLTRQMIFDNTTTWLGSLDKVVRQYNTTVHSYIGITPYESFVLKKPRKTPTNTEHRKVVKKTLFNIGDRVRILEKRKLFDKGSEANNYTSTIYEVVKREGDRYTIKNPKHGNVLKRTVLSREMLLTKSQPVGKSKRDKEKDKTKRYNKSDRRINKDLGISKKQAVAKVKRDEQRKKQAKRLKSWTSNNTVPRGGLRSGKIRK